MAKEIYVVDQNVMRRPELAEFMAAQPRAKFVIPDTGLVEMVKSAQWEETFRRNFEVLVPVMTRCFMSISVHEALDLELERRASVEGRLLPTDFTNLLRGAIVESQSGNPRKLTMIDKSYCEPLNAEISRIMKENPASYGRCGGVKPKADRQPCSLEPSAALTVFLEYVAETITQHSEASLECDTDPGQKHGQHPFEAK